MPKHIAKWNPARDAWEDTRGGASLFCGHSDVYSGTFPSSGMTRNGVAYELRTWEHRMGDTGYSSSRNDEDDALVFLPTPRAMDYKGGRADPNDTAPGRRRVEEVVKLLPTPSANVGMNGGSQDPAKRRAGGHQPSIQDVAEHETDWGRFDSAIKRWEAETGQRCPTPVVPDGRNGKHRLDPAFVEWMMGLPGGWVTDVDITRNEQLKALGNGVVPQQCTAALKDMVASFSASSLSHVA